MSANEHFVPKKMWAAALVIVSVVLVIVAAARYFAQVSVKQTPVYEIGPDPVNLNPHPATGTK